MRYVTINTSVTQWKPVFTVDHWFIELDSKLHHIKDPQVDKIWLRTLIWKDSVEASLHSLIVWLIDGIKVKINWPLVFLGTSETLNKGPLGVHVPDFENRWKIRLNICYLYHFLQWKLPWSCSPHQPPRLGSPPGLTGRWAVAACTHGTPDRRPCPPPACSAPRPAQTGRRGAAETGETKHVYSERRGSVGETVTSRNVLVIFRHFHNTAIKIIVRETKLKSSTETFTGHFVTAEKNYLALVVLELSVAVEEARQLYLGQSLTLFEVAETPPVKLTLRLPGLLVHLRHDALDQLQLNKTKCGTGSVCCMPYLQNSENSGILKWMELIFGGEDVKLLDSILFQIWALARNVMRVITHVTWSDIKK